MRDPKFGYVSVNCSRVSALAQQPPNTRERVVAQDARYDSMVVSDKQVDSSAEHESWRNTEIADLRPN